jgi:hypothetical protein
MTTGRGKHLSMAVDGTVSSGGRKLSDRRHTEQKADTPALLDLAARQRKPAVLHAMPTIRWLLTMHRFQVDAYSDDAIADALLETCPRPDDFWLRTEHLALAVQRVSAARKPDTAS